MVKLVDLGLYGALLAATAVSGSIGKQALERKVAEEAKRDTDWHQRTQKARQQGLSERFAQGDRDIIYIGTDQDKQFEHVQSTLPIFPGFEHVDYHIHDQLILDSVAKWNDHFKHVKGYTALDPVLVKAICLTESGSPRDRLSWRCDPMSLAHEGDLGFEDLIKRDDAHLIPGNPELAKLERTLFKHDMWRYDGPRAQGHIQIYSGLSIDEGVHLLIHKGLKFSYVKGKLEASFRGWDDAIKRYNGGGDKRYFEKVMDKYHSVKE